MDRQRSVSRSRSARRSDSGVGQNGLVSRGSIREVKGEDWGNRYGSMGVRTSMYLTGQVASVESERVLEDGPAGGAALPRRITTRRATNAGPSTGYGGVDFRRGKAMDNGEEWGAEQRKKRVIVRQRQRAGDVDEPMVDECGNPYAQYQIPFDPGMMMPPPWMMHDPDDQAMPTQIYAVADTAVYGNQTGVFNNNGR